VGTPQAGPGDHYFSESPSAASRPRTVRVTARGLDFALTTDRSTFSPNRVDPGTALLLDQAPAPPPSGRVLDLGCGYGPIACTLGQLAPEAEVVAIDVNERSRELCAANAAALGLGNVTVATPDDADGGRFDLIWSNPPIRVGKQELHDVLLRWLRRLEPHGSAVLVVNRHLGADSLQRWLGEQGYPTERLASKKGYRLLRSTVRSG
jgi:16S rRNA (guanine1207-N2)-methyltransferase